MTDPYRIALACAERGMPVPERILVQLTEEEKELLVFVFEQALSLRVIGTMTPGGEPERVPPGLQLIEEGEGTC